jgi:hypothetical protein
MTESARGNVFINSQINGRLELAGQNNNFIETKVGEIKKNHPVWFWFTIAGTIIGIVTGLMFLAQFFGFLPFSFQKSVTPYVDETFATSTIHLSELLSKTLTYDTVVERQDFLTKYKGELVSGQSTIDEVSRTGDDFLVDFYVNRQMITCWQSGNEENERRLVLMKGKDIRFMGTFSYIKVFEHGLGLDDCVINQM